MWEGLGLSLQTSQNTQNFKHENKNHHFEEVLKDHPGCVNVNGCRTTVGSLLDDFLHKSSFISQNNTKGSAFTLRSKS